MFELDKTLEKDTFFVKDLTLCKLLLLNNRFYPWLVLVPKRSQITETFELILEDQKQLTTEINQISKLSKQLFKADKMNIATFGNVVSQLHIHVISRYKNDRVFPNPVWLDKEKQGYGMQEASNLILKIQQNLN